MEDFLRRAGEVERVVVPVSGMGATDGAASGDAGAGLAGVGAAFGAGELRTGPS
jgi:hypothetical protein